MEYLPLGGELRKQTSIVGKKYLGLNKVYEFYKKEGNDETINKEERDDDKAPTI